MGTHILKITVLYVVLHDPKNYAICPKALLLGGERDVRVQVAIQFQTTPEEPAVKISMKQLTELPPVKISMKQLTQLPPVKI